MTAFEKLLRQIQNPHVYIQTHSFPDPDAIASAYGLQNLLKHRGIESTICYTGKIDRFSTVKMVEALQIRLFHVRDIPGMTAADEVILVDSQIGNVNREDIGGNVIGCIDHHPDNHQNHYRISDIRQDVGSCSSIVGQYYIENGIPFDKNTATALLYGIKIDTANLSRGVSETDLSVFYHVYHLCDMDVLHHLEHSVLQLEDLHAYANAINSIQIINKISFASTGIDCPEALIATISDFMMSISDVYLSVVYSIRQDGIKLSVRSKYSACNAGLLCANALDGIGNGGGHAHMAGGFVPFTGSAEEAKELIKEIKRRFLEKAEL